MSDSLGVRVEQCVALGRSRRWILSHLPVTEKDIRAAYGRIQEAHDGPPPRTRVAPPNARSVRDNEGDNKTVDPDAVALTTGVRRGLASPMQRTD